MKRSGATLAGGSYIPCSARAASTHAFTTGTCTCACVTTVFFASRRYDLPLGLAAPGALIASTSTLCLATNMFAQPATHSTTLAPTTHARTREKQPEGFMRLTLLVYAVSYTHLRAHETPEHLVCRL